MTERAKHRADWQLGVALLRRTWSRVAQNFSDRPLRCLESREGNWCRACWPGVVGIGLLHDLIAWVEVEAALAGEPVPRYGQYSEQALAAEEQEILRHLRQLLSPERFTQDRASDCSAGTS